MLLSQKIKPCMVGPATADLSIVKDVIVSGDKAKAISLLKEIVSVDYHNTEAIALLGGLQFERPEQPINDLLKKSYKHKVAEVILEIRNPCNYRCFYCIGVGLNNVPTQKFDLEKIRKTYELIEADFIVTSFECGGGEPTIHPQFKQIAELCASRGVVSFPTNNSQDPRRWLPESLASQLYLRAAVHPEAEDDLQMYVDNAKYLMDKGCTFTSIYIAHPSRLEKIPEYKLFFEKNRVPFTPVAYIGMYNDKEYPQSYSYEERELLGLNIENRYWGHKIQAQTTRIRNFRGIPCLAGHQSFLITKDGRLQRCGYDRRRIDKPLKKAEPCDINQCGCGLMLKEVNSINSIDIHSFWADLAGKKRADHKPAEQKATELGYTSLDDALAKENGDMYEELMRAYGKNDL